MNLMQFVGGRGLTEGDISFLQSIGFNLTAVYLECPELWKMNGRSASEWVGSRPSINGLLEGESRQLPEGYLLQVWTTMDNKVLVQAVIGSVGSYHYYGFFEGESETASLFLEQLPVFTRKKDGRFYGKKFIAPSWSDKLILSAS